MHGSVFLRALRAGAISSRKCSPLLLGGARSVAGSPAPPIWFLLIYGALCRSGGSAGAVPGGGGAPMSSQFPHMLVRFA